MKRLWKTISPCLSDTLGGKQRDGVRIVHSDIRSADIIYGTEEKVLSASQLMSHAMLLLN